MFSDEIWQLNSQSADSILLCTGEIQLCAFITSRGPQLMKNQRKKLITWNSFCQQKI